MVGGSSMERNFFTALDDITDPYIRQGYTDAMSIILRIARLTDLELDVVESMYALVLRPEMFMIDKINAFFHCLKRSGLRPDHYWEYLLPADNE